MEYYVISSDKEGKSMISGSSNLQYAFWTEDIQVADKFYDVKRALSRAEMLSRYSSQPISMLKIGVVEVIDVEKILGND